MSELVNKHDGGKTVMDRLEGLEHLLAMREDTIDGAPAYLIAKDAQDVIRALRLGWLKQAEKDCAEIVRLEIRISELMSKDDR
jgi:hypothetical protein